MGKKSRENDLKMHLFRRSTACTCRGCLQPAWLSADGHLMESPCENPRKENYSKMSSKMNSDDDFFEPKSPIKRKRNLSRSNNRSSQSSQAKKSKLSLEIESQVSNEKSKNEPGFCVNCQMPLELLHRWESPEVHASSCLESNFDQLPPCPQGVECDCTIRSHFIKFNHFLLASFRDNPDTNANSTESQSQSSSSTDLLSLSSRPLRKFKFKKPQPQIVLEESSEISEKSRPKTVNLEDSDDVLYKNKYENGTTSLSPQCSSGSDLLHSDRPLKKFKKSETKIMSEENSELSNKSQPKTVNLETYESDKSYSVIDLRDTNDDESIKILTTEVLESPDNSEDNFETPPEEKIVFSDDDDLFEELTNKALQIDAIKNDDGGLEIKVKVDPNVELNSLSLKIPSPTQDNKINVVGKINTKKKQSTLDSFFGLKMPSSSRCSEIVEKAKSKGKSDFTITAEINII